MVQVSEHPITIDDSTANVSYILDKLSREAFNGSRVKLLNAKNILIANVDGTRGKAKTHACTHTHTRTHRHTSSMQAAHILWLCTECSPIVKALWVFN